MKFISVKNNIGTPKYKQIISSVEIALENGIIKKGDQLPSINSIRNEFSLSRDTVLLAFNELKLRGIVQSIAGKGYYIKSENTNVKQKIFLLFDELNTFKENLYNSFINNLNANVEVDIFFHHFNHDVFNNLIYNNVGNYNSYIIMPANLTDTHLVIEKLPKNKVYILDQIHPDLKEYPAIYQNFEKDSYNSLSQVLKSIQKFKKFIFIFSDEKQPQGMLKGFNKFCADNSIQSEIISNAANHEIIKEAIYLIPDDKNLTIVIKKLKLLNFELAKDIGIISYNETILKEIVEGGITTISTDFDFMGNRLAEMVMKKETIQIENPSTIIIRNSI